MITIENIKARVKGVSVSKLTFEDQYLGNVYEDEHALGFAQISLNKTSHIIKNVRMFNNRNIIFDVTIINTPYGRMLQDILSVGIKVEYIPLVNNKNIYGIHCKPIYRNLKQTRIDKLKEIFKNSLFTDAKS